MKLRFTALAVIVSLTACPKKEPPEAASPTPSGPPTVQLTAEGTRNAEIETAVVSTERFTPKLTVVATLGPDPLHSARVGARVAGRVASLDVKLGQAVKKGQQLAAIETVEVHLVSSEFLTAVARAREANDTLERQKQLVQERVGALQDLRRAEANAEAENATLREAEEHLHFLGLSTEAIAAVRAGVPKAAERSIVRAPIDGRVASISVALGQVLAGTEDILTIVDSADLWATLQIYERDSVGVVVGSTVEVQVPAWPDRLFKGTIEAVGEVIDPQTHTVEARVKLVNEDSALKSGMTATAFISLKTDGEHLWLPAEAVQPRGSERIVFVQVGENRFEGRTVGAGVERNGFVPIRSGLEAGAKVVVRGAFSLRAELDHAELSGD